MTQSRDLTDSLTHAYAKCENRHGRSVYHPFSKTKYFFYFFIGQSPRFRVDSLRFVLWSVFEKYCGQSPKIIFILNVPSNPKHMVDHFHALTPMSYDASFINAMQVSLHVISCYMYATCHMQHINHTLHLKCHG